MPTAASSASPLRHRCTAVGSLPPSRCHPQSGWQHPARHWGGPGRYRGRGCQTPPHCPHCPCLWISLRRGGRGGSSGIKAGASSWLASSEAATAPAAAASAGSSNTTIHEMPIGSPAMGMFTAGSVAQRRCGQTLEAAGEPGLAGGRCRPAAGTTRPASQPPLLPLPALLHPGGLYSGARLQERHLAAAGRALSHHFHRSSGTAAPLIITTRLTQAAAEELQEAMLHARQAGRHAAVVGQAQQGEGRACRGGGRISTNCWRQGLGFCVAKCACCRAAPHA